MTEPDPDVPVPDLEGDTSMRRLHPLTPLLKSWVVVAAGIGYLWSQLTGLVEGQLFGSSMGDADGGDLSIGIWGLIFIGALLVALTYGYVYWRATKYGIVGAVLRVETGVLFRQTRQVALDRLQAVDIVRPWIARIAGLAELRLEVAGGGSSEAPLAYLSLPEANRLRAELLARAAGLDASTPEAPEQAVVRVPTAQLALGSALSGVTIAFVLFGGGLLVAVLLTGATELLIPVLPAVVGMGVAAVRQFVANYGFTVAESPDGLRIRKGLLDTRSQTVPPGRVQAVRVTQPLLWRSFGLVRLDVNVAGYAADNDKENEQTSVLLPVGPRPVADMLLARVLPGVDVSRLTLAPAPARVRSLRPVGWKHLAAGGDDTVFAATRGWTSRELVLMPHAKPQSMRITQGPLQRRLDVASVALDTTKGPVSVVAYHRDASDARALLDAEVAHERRARLAAMPDRWQAGGGSPSAPDGVVAGPEPVGQLAPHRLDEPSEAPKAGGVEQLGHGTGGG